MSIGVRPYDYREHRPGIGTGVAYASGDCIGTKFQLKLPGVNAGGILNSIVVTDKNAQNVTIRFHFFEGEPGGTYTDNAAIAVTANDIHKHIGYADVNSYVSLDSKSIGFAPDVNNVQSTKTTVWVVPEARGAGTFTNGDALRFRFEFFTGN